jgi:hypothetical protein
MATNRMGSIFPLITPLLEEYFVFLLLGVFKIDYVFYLRTLLPNDRQTIFDTVHSVGYLCEVTHADPFLCTSEGAIVSAGQMKLSASQQFHKHLWSCWVTA